MSISKWLLDPTIPHRAVGDLVHRRWAQIQRGEYEVCLALRRLFGDNVHRHEGFSRFADYAEQRYGIPGKLADLFCFIAGHLGRLPKTRAALEERLTPGVSHEFTARISATETGWRHHG